MAVIVRFTVTMRRGAQPWSNTELAEFARITNLLRSSGLPVISETGLSDEGDPWTVFLREDTRDVIAHIARIDGRIVAASITTDEVFYGVDFRALLEQIVKRQPLVMPAAKPGATLLMHPAAILTAFIATAASQALIDSHGEHRASWIVDGDATISLKQHGNDAGAGIANPLRAALAGKAETARPGSEAPALGGAGTHMLAAAIAAVTVAAAASDMQDMFAGLASAGEDASKNAVHVSAVAPAAAADADGDPAAPGAGDAILAEYDPAASADAPALAAARQDAPSGDGEQSAAPTDPPAAGNAAAGTGRATEPAGEGLSLAAPGGLQAFWLPDTDADGTAGNGDGGAATAPNAAGGKGLLAIAAGTDMPAAAGAGEQTFEISADAVDLFQLSVAPGQFRLSAGWLLSFEEAAPRAGGNLGPEIGALAEGPAGGAGAGADALSASGAHSVADAGAAQAAAQAANEASYRLIGEVLSFAFSEHNELALEAEQLATVSRALAQHPFLNLAERVLVIDTADLRADVFQFSDGLLMMSQDMAHQLLPTLSLEPGAELGLANGDTLKLIGVIDLEPIAG